MGSVFVFTSILVLGFYVFVQFVTSQNVCDCRGGCNLTETCYKNSCKLKNVAVGKVANSSPVYSNSIPCLAVDGIAHVDQCTETAQGDLNPFWRVDLGQEYIVHFMTVYRRWNWSIRMVGLKIYVEDQLCDTIEKNEIARNPSSLLNGPPVPISITCSTTLTGRYVTLVKNATQVDLEYHREIMDVCEVQVWGMLTPTTSATTTTATTTTTTTAPATASTTTKTLLLVVIAGSVGAVVAVVVPGLLVVVIIVKRRKRGSTSKKEPALEFQAQEPTVTVVAAIVTSVTEPTTTPGNVYENTDEETGHCYCPLSHRDDNTLYTALIFNHSEKGEGASMAAPGVTGTASMETTDNVYEVIGDDSGMKGERGTSGIEKTNSTNDPVYLTIIE